MPSNRSHRDPRRILVRCLLVLGLTSGALLFGSATPASAGGQCYSVYYGPYGATVCP